MICSYAHKQFTCEVSAQYLKNSSTGYASKFISVIEAKSLKFGPGLQILLKNFRDATDTKMVLSKVVSMDIRISKPNFQFNIYILRALTDTRSLLQSLKQNCRKLAQVCKIEKQPSFTEIQFYMAQAYISGCCKKANFSYQHAAACSAMQEFFSQVCLSCQA